MTWQDRVYIGYIFTSAPVTRSANRFGYFFFVLSQQTADAASTNYWRELSRRLPLCNILASPERWSALIKPV